MGTPQFMSPEQCRGEAARRAQRPVFAGGDVLHPAGGSAAVRRACKLLQVMFAHCSKPAPDPCGLRADIPGGLRADRAEGDGEEPCRSLRLRQGDAGVPRQAPGQRGRATLGRLRLPCPVPKANAGDDPRSRSGPILKCRSRSDSCRDAGGAALPGNRQAHGLGPRGDRHGRRRLRLLLLVVILLVAWKPFRKRGGGQGSAHRASRPITLEPRAELPVEASCDSRGGVRDGRPNRFSPARGWQRAGVGCRSSGKVRRTFAGTKRGHAGRGRQSALAGGRRTRQDRLAVEARLRAAARRARRIMPAASAPLPSAPTAAVWPWERTPRSGSMN